MQESRRVLDLLGRALVCVSPEEADEVAGLAREAAYEAEREAVGAGAGLSKYQQPSRVVRRGPVFSSRAVEAARTALASEIGAVVFDPDRRRLSRLRASVGIAARFHSLLSVRSGFRADQAWMVTLTYRPGVEWCAEQITLAVNAFRRWCDRRRVSARYVWVAELQLRGAVHYHLVCWLPRGLRMPKWDVRVSAGSAVPWWPHGMTNRVLVRKCAVGYLMKYLSKGTEYGSMPKGARVHGSGGAGGQCRAVRRWVAYPAFIRARASVEDRWVRATGGGWLDSSGRWWASEYAPVLIGGKRGAVRVVDHGRPFVADGPYSCLRGVSDGLVVA